MMGFLGVPCRRGVRFPNQWATLSFQIGMKMSHCLLTWALTLLGGKAMALSGHSVEDHEDALAIGVCEHAALVAAVQSTARGVVSVSL